ncbi:SDR family oxidoreductase [Alkaliphilus sp. MSJ-5]|uniref:SDR family oxidoreductase n=1 Tax=Alkaliphilus flagellatus TaxID=2841507 RepID=A0ABS6G1T0_9FIRM|nr:SDR family oxidoreductase [Alkaliphilus flagellatus]MBU5676432.1 SDR family oxidoreductase [Alkaliphilus flagellatus]
MKLVNKTVLITGGSKGIGSAITKLFAQNNYNVIINYLKSEKEALDLQLSLLKEGYNALAYRADITKRDEVEAMINEGIKKFGTIDVIVNNAGISEQKLFTDITEQEWDNMMNVHIKGMFNCSQCALPHMISRKQGKIINISSIWGMVGASCEVHYSTAKAGIIGFTKALAKELGPSNIQVNCVAPGIIETDMNSFLDEKEKECLVECTPLLRFGKPEEVAQSVLYLASDKADFITGQVIGVNGGFVI